MLDRTSPIKSKLLTLKSHLGWRGLRKRKVKEECMVYSTFELLAFMFYHFMDQYALGNTLLVHFHCLYISWQA